MDDLFVAAIDVGSPENLGIATNEPKDEKQSITNDVSTSMELLLNQIASKLKSGNKRVALGFEAPMWIPMRKELLMITKARPDDGGKAWSAQTAPTVLSLALIPWCLDRLKRELEPSQLKVTVNIKNWKPGILFLWEAFVSGEAKNIQTDCIGSAHDRDAQIALDAFIEQEKNKTLKNIPIDLEIGCFSIIEACLHSVGLTLIGSENDNVYPLIIKPEKKS